MTLHTADDLALHGLASRLAGEVLTPSSPGYDEARTLFNAMIDRRPRVIARCATPADVAVAIRFARDHDLEIAVRGGGHGVAGAALCDGGLVIDLRDLHEVTVDPAARMATVGGGATMRHLDTAAQAYGLATTGGRTSTTGVAGLVLGGGTGWLDRLLGLACDQLVAAELVTSDGERLRASADEHPDLFWALHGGGGNFGVVTSLVLRLHPVGSITATVLTWDPAAAPEVLRVYRDVLSAAPDEVGGAVKLHTAPDAPWVSAALRGRRACTVLVTDAGSGAAANEVTRPLLGIGPAGRLDLEVPYAELQHLLDDPPGYRNAWSAEYLDAVPDAAVDRFCARAADLIVPSPSEQLLVPLGGAVARNATDHPIPWRRAAWHVFPFALWADPADDARARAWTRALREDVAPWSTGAVYLNFIGDEGHDRVVAGFGADGYARLAEVKAAYDPDNVFHLNHNVLPA